MLVRPSTATQLPRRLSIPRFSPQPTRLMSAPSESFPTASAERVAELKENVQGITDELSQAAQSVGRPNPRLVLVSKLKPPSDILGVHQATGHQRFGENYIQELVEKSQVLPREIEWHFIGALQSNKCKTLASIPNLKVLETLDSVKKADALEKTLASQEPQDRVLDVFLQVNTSAEDVKSGLPALEAPPDALAEGASLDTVPTLAKHIQDHCPHLRLAGLMTIGSWEHSHEEPEQENPDFVKLTQTRNYLAGFLNVPKESLELSMGMSADFVQATKQGSDNVRVGSKAFGTRPSKEEAKALRDQEKSSKT